MRAPTHSIGAAAQRRTAKAELSWPSRGMAAIRGPRAACRVGWSPPGEESSGPPLRPRRSRHQPSFGQIRPSEAAWERPRAPTRGTDGDCRNQRSRGERHRTWFWRPWRAQGMRRSGSTRPATMLVHDELLDQARNVAVKVTSHTIPEFRSAMAIARAPAEA